MWLLVSSRRPLLAPLTCLFIIIILVLLVCFHETFTSNPTSSPPNQRLEIVANRQQSSWLVLGTNQASQADDDINSNFLSPDEEESQLEQQQNSSNPLLQETSFMNHWANETSTSTSSSVVFVGQRSTRKGRASENSQQAARIRRLAHHHLVDRRPILNEFSFPANLVQGMRFVLMCQVLDGDLPIQIKWFKDQQELLIESSSSSLSSSSRSAVAGAGAASIGDLDIELLSNDELGSSLLFRKVLPKHSGNYTCLAKNHLGSTSFSSSLSVKIPPKWRIEPQDQAETIIGDHATIDCQSEGNPNPFIRWKFSPNQQQHQQQSALANSQLTTSMEQQQQQQQQQQHQNGHLMATAESLASSLSFKLINSNHHVQTLENGSLAIRLVSKEDEGFYLCEADNGLEPSLSKVMRLIVHQQAQILDDLKLLGSDPHQQQQQQQQAPPVGLIAINPPGSPVIKSVRLYSSQPAAAATSQSPAATLRVLCQPSGDLPLTVDWLKDEQLIYSHTILSPEISTISSAGSSSSSSTVVSATATTTAMADQQQQQQMGRLHVNTRRSSTRSPPSQQQQPPLNTFESELYLTGLRRSDAGLFTCLAKNAFGRNERRMKLVLQEPPEPPEIVDVGHIGSRSIGLRWLPSGFDGNSPIVKYIVEYRRLAPHADPTQPNWPATATTTTEEQQQQLLAATQMATDHHHTATTFTGQSERIIQPIVASEQQPVLHTVHDLEPMARYSMRVIAVNAVGRSRPSVALTMSTEEEVPSVIPSLVGAVVLGSRSVRLHWTLAYSPEREIIDGFFIGYRSFDTQALIHEQQQQQQQQQNSKPPTQSSAARTGQPPDGQQQQQQPTFTYKTVRLNRATTQDRAASTAAAAAARQQAAEQLDPSSAYISPLSSITKSIIIPNSQASSNNLQQQQQQQVVSSSFEYIIGALERNTEYSIFVQCFNKKGAGPASDPVIFKTFANDPPEKLALSADEISESSVRVNWRFILPIGQSDKYQLVDGFVLAFAKLINNHLRLANELSNNNNNNRQASVAAARIAASSPSSSANLSQANIDQWQAIQLAPQQRQHQLKNLECGTSYAMKIWAFNKIGKGEPSDLVTVSTRGKAPIAPDRRSFLSINNTQVRLHLSAWYDGGCEIDKFIVQYRVRGQPEWILVSNNILREQLSVVIRDLLPATSYELLVGAQNQVGLTEVKYRFITLDQDGKQVPSIEGPNSFASSSTDDSEVVVDYSEVDGTMREFWPASGGNYNNNNNNNNGDPNHSMTKSMLVVRQFMNSPVALMLSLCFFVVLLMVLIFYKFNGQSSHSSVSTLNLNSSNKSSGGRTSSSGTGEPNMTMMNDGELMNGAAPSVANTSGSGCTDSPARTMSSFQQQQQLAPHPSIRLLNSANHYLNPTPEQPSCHYQPFCNPSMAQQQQQQQTDTHADYSHYGLPSATYETSTGNLYSGLPVPQRSATMDQVVSQSAACMMADQDRSRQLIQMLMLQGAQNQQQHLEQIPESATHPGDTPSYAAAALTTMARGANRQIKQLNNHPFQANTLGRQPMPNNANFLEQTRRPEATDSMGTEMDAGGAGEMNHHYPMSTFRQTPSVQESTGAQLASCIIETQTNSTGSDCNSANCSTAASSTSGRGTIRGSLQETIMSAGGRQIITCDNGQNKSPYDVPFKIRQSANDSNSICY